MHVCAAHVCVSRVCVRDCALVRVRVCVRLHVHTLVDARVGSCECAHACGCARLRARVGGRMCEGAHACARVRMRLCVYV